MLVAEARLLKVGWTSLLRIAVQRPIETRLFSMKPGKVKEGKQQNLDSFFKKAAPPGNVIAAAQKAGPTSNGTEPSQVPERSLKRLKRAVPQTPCTPAVAAEANGPLVAMDSSDASLEDNVTVAAEAPQTANPAPIQAAAAAGVPCLTAPTRAELINPSATSVEASGPGPSAEMQAPEEPSSTATIVITPAASTVKPAETAVVFTSSAAATETATAVAALPAVAVAEAAAAPAVEVAAAAVVEAAASVAVRVPVVAVASMFVRKPKTSSKAVAALAAKAAGDSDKEEDEKSASPPVKRARSKSPVKKAKGADKAATTSKMDGVGTGALEMALLAEGVDVAKLITWAKGKPVPYAFLANTFEEISMVTKRLTITHMLTNAFRAILASRPDDLLPAVYMCVNRLAPAHEGLELGLGEATLLKALAESTGQTDKTLKKEYEKLGDLGAVAVAARAMQKTMFPMPALTLAGVFKSFKDIALMNGKDSSERKRGAIIKLLVASKGNESGYIVRSLQGKLRIGLAEQSMLAALAHAVLLHKHDMGDGEPAEGERLAERLEAATVIVKTTFSECPSFDEMIPALLQYPISSLPDHCHFMPGVPVKPMLAKATTGVGEVLDKFSGQEFTCEYKYDGERAQVHVLPGGKIHIFSRNAEENTSKYPDILQRLPSLLKPGVTSIVFDSEAVGWDAERKKVLPFQILSTRGRKDVALADVKIQVVLFAFDCLFLNGESLLHKPLTERRAALYASLDVKEGQLEFATTKTSTDIEELQNFLTEAVDASTEGLIVKTLADTYEPSRRSSHWLKLKKDYMDGVGDTLDVVPVGAWYGKGKRTGVFGAYLLAVYDDDGETYQTICKVGTGFSEEVLVTLAEGLRANIIPQASSYYRWGETLVPDVWFDPCQVWEVKCADMTISPVHKAAAGLVDPIKGISLRFPRLLRVRDDKNPEDATTAHQVVDMYKSQAVVKNNAKTDEQDDEY